jgi:antitoxin (DNA-binding transcriptional repressor) of toxin-antitoxin stability system
MTTVELDVIAADLPAFLDKVAGGETILISSGRRPVAELRPPNSSVDELPDEQELARRRQLGLELAELRTQITKESGMNPDSTLMIREMRDHGREIRDHE